MKWTTPSNEFNLAGLRSILQRLEKSAEELAKANEALHAEMTDDELLGALAPGLDCHGVPRHGDIICNASAMAEASFLDAYTPPASSQPRDHCLPQAGIRAVDQCFLDGGAVVEPCDQPVMTGGCAVFLPSSGGVNASADYQDEGSQVAAIRSLGAELEALGDLAFAAVLQDVQAPLIKTKAGLAPADSPLTYQQSGRPHNFKLNQTLDLLQPKEQLHCLLQSKIERHLDLESDVLADRHSVFAP
ncbi:hypothetical protein MTO96_008619 [Rhipicephalus appendiculatus]